MRIIAKKSHSVNFGRQLYAEDSKKKLDRIGLRGSLIQAGRLYRGSPYSGPARTAKPGLCLLFYDRGNKNSSKARPSTESWPAVRWPGQTRAFAGNKHC